MINYTFAVTRTDTDRKVMEVRYTADGFEPVDVGMPIPLVGQDLTQMIQQYAPSSMWENSIATFQTVNVGHSGTLTFDKNAPVNVPAIDPTELANQQMWAQVEFEKKIAAVLVKFGVIINNPTAIPVTTL
jgi:hypothetical protein